MIPVRKMKKLFSMRPAEWKDAVRRGVRRYIFETPDHIIIQVVEACNLSCEHCHLTRYGKEISEGRKRILTYPEFEKRLKRMEGAVRKASYVQLSSFETLMHKDVFKMMDAVLAVNPRVTFPILTNGMLVDRSKLEQLKRYPLHEFTVSLDGSTAKTVEAFKTGVRFDKVVDVVRMAVEIDLGVPVGTVFVAHRGNIHELPDTVDLVADLGVRQLAVNNLLAFTPAFSDRTLYSDEEQDKYKAIFDQASERANQRGVTLLLPGLTPKLQGCSSAEILFVDTDGNVSPCDFLTVDTPFTFRGKTYQSGSLHFGNIMDQDALKIFRSKKLRAFRQAHRTGKQIPEQCLGCIDAYGLMCSNRAELPPE